MERCSARSRSLRIRTPVHTDRSLNVLDFLRGGWILNRNSFLVKKCCEGIAGDAKHAAPRRALRFIIHNIAASLEMTQSET